MNKGNAKLNKTTSDQIPDLNIILVDVIQRKMKRGTYFSYRIDSAVPFGSELVAGLGCELEARP